MRLKLLLITIITFAGLYCTDTKYSDIERTKLIQGFLLQNVTATKATAIDCTTSASTKFSNLDASGLSSRCASCHGSSSKIAGLDVTSYSSSIALVSAGNPEGSVFYTKINGGSMASYSDTTLNNAVYCWIKLGASQ